MIYFEDLVIEANDLLNRGYVIQLNDWSRNFIMNVADRLKSDSNARLSTNQANTLKKIMPIFVKNLAKTVDQRPEIELAIADPTYRNELYISPAMKKEVRHVGANFLGFRYKYNEHLTKELKDKAGSGNYKFDKKTYLWLVTVDEHNFEAIIDFIKENKFETDTNTEAWFALCKDGAKHKISSFVFDSDSNCIIANIVSTHISDFVKYFLEGIYI